jgi:hypothetical protein
MSFFLWIPRKSWEDLQNVDQDSLPNELQTWNISFLDSVNFDCENPF